MAFWYFFVWAGIGLTTPFVPVFLRERGFSYTQIGQLAFLAALVGFLTQIAIGAWSDRLRRRKPFIVAGSLTMAAAYAVFPLLHAFPAFVGLYLLTGLGQYTALTTSSALVLDSSPPGAAARTFAGLRIWGSLGFVTMMTLGWAAPRIFTTAVLFQITPLVFMAAALSVLPISEPLLERDSTTAVRRALPWEGLALLKEPGVPVLLGVVFLLHGTLQGASSSLVLWMNSLNAGQRIVHLAFMVSASIEIPFMLSVGKWSDRFGRRPLLAITGIALPIRMILYSLVFNAAWVPAIQTMHGLTFSVLAVVPMAYINDVTPEDRRAAGQGLLNAVLAGAVALGPLVIGILTDALGFHRMYRALAIPAATGGLLLLLRLRESNRNAIQLQERFLAKAPAPMRPVLAFLLRGPGVAAEAEEESSHLVER